MSVNEKVTFDLEQSYEDEEYFCDDYDQNDCLDDFELTVTDDIDDDFADEVDDTADPATRNFNLHLTCVDDEVAVDLSDYSPTYPTYGNQVGYSPWGHSYCYTNEDSDRTLSPEVTCDRVRQTRSDTNLIHDRRDDTRYMHRSREMEGLSEAKDDTSPYEEEKPFQIKHTDTVESSQSVIET